MIRFSGDGDDCRSFADVTFVIGFSGVAVAGVISTFSVVDISPLFATDVFFTSLFSGVDCITSSAFVTFEFTISGDGDDIGLFADVSATVAGAGVSFTVSVVGANVC